MIGLLRKHGTLWWRSHSAAAATLFSLMLPCLALAAGACVDFSTIMRQRALAQSAADSVALNIASQMQLATADPKALQVASRTMMRQALRSEAAGVIQVVPVVDAVNRTVRVTATMPVQLAFGQIVGFEPKVVVQASAKSLGASNLCLMALNALPVRDPGQGFANVGIDTAGTSQVLADDCVLATNAVAAGLAVRANASVTAKKIYAVDKTPMIKGLINPVPLPTKPIADPLAKRVPPPSSGPCVNTKTLRFNNAGQTDTIYPGVYCADVVVGNGATLNLAGGTYVFRNARLQVNLGTLNGSGVGIYMQASACVPDESNAQASVFFNNSANINLTAAADGDMPSIVIWNDTPGTCAASGQFGAPVVIQSKLVRNITGILYLPRSNLTVRKDSDVASQSWWTCIVAGAVTFEAGAKVYLNAAYTGAPVQPPPTILNNPDLPGTVLTQ